MRLVFFLMNFSTPCVPFPLFPFPPLPPLSVRPTARSNWTASYRGWRPWLCHFSASARPQYSCVRLLISHPLLGVRAKPPLILLLRAMAIVPLNDQFSPTPHTFRDRGLDAHFLILLHPVNPSFIACPMPHLGALSLKLNLNLDLTQRCS